MQHRIIVLGAGYAGAYTAGILARRLHQDDFQITVVNAEPDFVERLRLHQIASGRDRKVRPLKEIFAGTGIRLRLARVTGVDPDHHTVAITDGDHSDLLEYDTLVYALGSTAASHDVPGVDEHGYHYASRPAALRLRARLDDLDAGGTVLIVGGNLTAIEGATEIAENHPDLQVALATRGKLGGRLGPKARRHLLQAFDRFGIAVHEDTAIAQVTADGARSTDGVLLDADATVWAAGFAVHPIAAASGLAVETNGQITVDRQMRSISHPDVYATGDAAFIIGENGLPLPMSCASAGYTSKQTINAIIGNLTGHDVAITKLPYIGNHISLGRDDAIFQLVDGDARSKPGALVGRPAARIKAAILNTASWTTGHPTFGLPTRKHHLATTTAPARKTLTT